MTSFFWIELIIFVCLYARLSSRLDKCEQLLKQLKASPPDEPKVKDHPPPLIPYEPQAKDQLPSTPPPVPEIAKPIQASITITPKLNEKSKIEKTKSFQIPAFIKENWMGVFGSIALVIGAVFFGLTSKIMQYPQARVAVMISASLLLFGISRKLKERAQWTLLRGWLQAIAGTVVLFAAIGAAGIEGLQFIHSPLYALGFLCAGIAFNILLASLSPSQTVSSLHVILCIIAFCLAPQSFILLPLGALVAAIGLVHAYRAKWDVHLLLIVMAFSFQNFYWSSKLNFEASLWMHQIAIGCSLIVGLLAGLIHYSKKYASPKLESLPLFAHLSNWGLLIGNIALHAQFYKWTPLVLGTIAFLGFMLARVAKKKGIIWLYHTDTLFSQLAALSAIVCLSLISVNKLDICLLIIIETLAFSIVFHLQKENFLAKVGNCSQLIASVILFLLAIDAIKSSQADGHFLIYLRMGIATALYWGYYLFSIWKKFPLDGYQFILNEPDSKNQLSLSTVMGSLFFLTMYAFGFDSWMMQAFAFAVILMISLWRKFKEDASSNLALVMALAVAHALYFKQLIILSLLQESASSIFGSIGLIIFDFCLIAGNCLEFKRWKKNLNPFLVYAIGLQAGLLTYVFTNGISRLIPGLAFLGFSLICLEAARLLPPLLKCRPEYKPQFEESIIQVGIAFLIGFLCRFVTVHLQIDPIWHGISLRWIVEACGLFALSYWLFFPPQQASYSKSTQYFLKSLVEAVLKFATLCVFVEMPEVSRPLFWVLFAIVLLLGRLHFNWPKRLYGYSWIYFAASIAHMAFVTSSLTMPNLFLLERYHILTLMAIALQFCFAYIVLTRQDAIKEDATHLPKVLQNLYSHSNFTVLLPVFLGIALLFAFNFEKAILTLLWVGLTSIYISIGLVIKSKRSIQIGMLALVFCSARLLIFDLRQSDPSTRALVFIGVGGLMLGMSILYKKYKHRIVSNEKA